MNSRAARLGLLLAGTALACTFASTAVAFKFHWETGYPWLGRWFYWPLDSWWWWRTWGHAEPYRTPFLKALTLCAPLLVLPAMLTHFWQMHAPLKPDRNLDKPGMGTVRELLRTGHIKRRGNGVVLGCDPGRWRWRQRTLRDCSDGSVLLVGPSGQGKGTGHVIPTALSYEGPLLCFDPKGDQWPVTGRYRATLGPVFVVNPTDPAGAKFNPLDEVRRGIHLIGDCTRFAYILIPKAERSGGNEKFWDDSARDVLIALLAHAVSSDEPTLDHVWRLVHDVVKGRMPQVRDPDARALLDDLKEAHDTTRRGVNKSLSTNLDFLVDPLIRHMTSSSDFRAGDLQAADRPVTVFLAPPVSDGQRLGPLMRVMIEACVVALTADLKRTADGRPKKHDLLIMLDEFAQLGRMKSVELLVPIARGFGIRLFMVCQSESQITSLYGQDQSITDNCRTIAYIGGFSGRSLETIARWGGQQAVVQSSKQMAASLRGSSSRSQSEAQRPLLDHGALIQRGGAEVLIFTLGGQTKRRRVAPTYLDKGRYFEMGEFRGRWDVQGAGSQTLPQIAAQVQLPDMPEQVQNEPVDNLDPDDAAMVASVEELVANMPAPAQEVFRHRQRFSA